MRKKLVSSSDIFLTLILGGLLFLAATLEPRMPTASEQLALDRFIERLVKKGKISKGKPRIKWSVPWSPSQEVKLSKKQRARLASISDGNFSELSKKWRDGMSLILRQGKCKVYDHFVKASVAGTRFATLKYLLVRAQMMVESNCDWLALNGGTDFGLLQVQGPTCLDDLEIKGNLFDPEINIRCASAYHDKLCRSYGKCTPADLLVAYNVGPTGSEKVADKRAHPYARKVHFALEQLFKHERRQAGV